MEDTATEAEAKGDVAFTSGGDFATEILYLSAAIDLLLTSYVLYSNRSAAHASLHNYSEALADATKTVELNPKWSKGYSCVGAAHLGLHQYDDAVAAYMKGLEHDPNNEGLKSGLAEAEAAAARARGNPGEWVNSFGDAFSSLELGLAEQKEKEPAPMQWSQSNTRSVTFKVPRVSGVEILDDGYKWRKYGEKVVLDSEYSM